VPGRETRLAVELTLTTRPRTFGKEKGSLQIHPEDLVPFLFTKLQEIRYRVEPGIVHQAIQSPEPTDRRLHEGRRLFGPGDIAGEGEEMVLRGPTRTRLEPLQPLATPGAGRHPGPMGKKYMGHSLSDAP